MTSADDAGDETLREAIARADARPDEDAIRFDIYANSSPQLLAEEGQACDPSGLGEGERYVGSMRVRTDRAGHAEFTGGVAHTAIGERMTATATKILGGDETQQPPPSTNQFSLCEEIRGE